MSVKLRNRNSYGLTTIELLMALLVVGGTISVIAFFVGNSLGVSRSQFKQVRATDDARVQLERVSQAVRNARNADCDGDDQVSASEFWIQEASEYALTIYTNIDDDEFLERVRYYVDPDSDELRATVEHENAATVCLFPPGQERELVLLKSLQNRVGGDNQPLFEYYAASVGAPIKLTLPVATESISLVKIIMDVDEDTGQEAGEAFVETMVEPRGMQQRQCLAVDSTNFSYTYSDDFALQAFSDCMDYCGGEQPGGGCCWWYVYFTNWDGTPYGDVQTQCLCSPFFIPSDLTKTSLYPGEYTDFVKSCMTFENGLCGDGNLGIPYCEPACLESGVQGECACACPTVG